MKSTNNPNINTRTYWNFMYMNPEKEREYWAMSNRFHAAFEEIHDGDRFLDMGCGVGVPCLMVMRDRKDCEAWGVDISDKIIEKNTANYPHIIWHQGYAGYCDFLPPVYFDVMFAGEIIEHLDDPQVLFDEGYRVLKKSGKLIVTTPREDRIKSPEHVWEYVEDDVEKFYMDAGFSRVEFKKLDDTEHMMVIFAIGFK